MVEIIGSKDCGNSPKNKRVEEIAIALETGNLTFLKELLTEESTWELSDKGVAEGEDILNHVQSRRKNITSITIDHAISHGKVGTANGSGQNKKGQVTGFSHVIEFTSAKYTKIHRICSYQKS